MAIQRDNSFLSRGPLFDDKARKQYISEKSRERIPDLQLRVTLLFRWVNAVRSLRAVASKETSLEADFYKQVMGDVLGYVTHPNLDATAYLKPPSRLTRTSKEPDALLGRGLTADNWQPTVVLEVKRPGTPFDVPQSRESHMTPVEQALEYGQTILGIRWVLVSDMLKIRLYSVDRPHSFVEFDLERCATDSAGVREFLELHFLLHREYLVGDLDSVEDAATTRLLRDSRTVQQDVLPSFYEAYSQIRGDLLAALEQASRALDPVPDNDELGAATQRLLDRILFICYCESSPDVLVRQGTLRRVIESARCLPGAAQNKVYTYLKALFHEIDVGSPTGSGVDVSGYNGELFKAHRILDVVDLPDSLALKKYGVTDSRGEPVRQIEGVWGLYVFDFWRELNEHLLGRIFEESLSYASTLRPDRGQASVAQKFERRHKYGVYYTTELLSDYLAAGALRSFLDETIGPDAKEPPRNDAALVKTLQRRADRLTTLKILDPSCGSGAFLVSAYHGLQAEHWRTQEAIGALKKGVQREFAADHKTHAAMLKQCLYGADLLPQAVEIAKLALWIRSARKGEKVATLSTNLIAADSLQVEALLTSFKVDAAVFDLVVGNPPWGAELAPGTTRRACRSLGLDPSRGWDSWELFVALGLHMLKPGGRLAYVLPDTFFSSEKAAIRELLLKNTQIEKIHSLGPGWFGPEVRMASIVLQVRKGAPDPDAEFSSLLLHGALRRQVISGVTPLTQVEARYARRIPQSRSLAHDGFPIEVFRDRRDDALMASMDASSESLADVCDRSRGEEMAKSGLLWRCPGCVHLTPPGKKQKGGTYQAKTCERCKLLLKDANCEKVYLVVNAKPGVVSDPFIDGDDVGGRYTSVTAGRWIRTDLEFAYKKRELYAAPKILLRQAGVGIAATLDTSGARCPQSVYLYRVNAAHSAWADEYVLAALLSRAMAYYVFKRFAEVDPARAHAKLTHDRLAALPIPRIDLGRPEHRRSHDGIVANVRKLLSGAALIGSAADWEIEMELRRLFGIGAEDGSYINEELKSVPESQAIRELFPPQ